MNKKEIEDWYKKKIKLFQSYNEYYYDKNAPKVSDKDYDELKKEILSLELKYYFLQSSKSPSKVIGFKPSKNFKKNINLISKIGGVILLITGILILTNQLQIVGFYLIKIFPFMQNFG